MAEELIDGDLVSVYIPCFEVASTLEAAVRSVLAQTHTNWELRLLADRGSNDATVEVAHRCASLDERITVQEVDHCTLTEKYQLGVEQARGAWVAPLDGDDVFRPQKLDRQLAAARENPAAVAWGCWWAQIGADGGHLRDTHHGPVTMEDFADHRRRHEVPVLVHSGTIMRRDAVLAVGGYDHSLQLAADFDLVDRLCDRGPVLAVPEVLVEYRLSGSSASLNRFREQSLQLEYVWVKRRRRDLGEESIGFEQWTDELRSASWWRRAGREARERARFHWRATGTAMAAHDRTGAVRNAVLAFASQPAWTLRRMFGQYLGHRSGGGPGMPA